MAWRKPGAITLSVVLLAISSIGGVYILVTALSPEITYLFRRPYSQTEAAPIVQDGQRSEPSHNRLYIPHIDIDVAIIESDNASALNEGAWHRKPENGNPERGGNFILSAHRFVMGWTPQQTYAKSPFYHIDKLKTGEKLYVSYNKKRYIYQITRKYKVSPAATEIEAPSASAKLTLYACTLNGAADGRDVIEAAPISEL